MSVATLWLSGPLSRRATAWHERRFPNGTMERVGLKLGSEVGELQDALVAVSPGSDEHPERATQVGAEMADVVIVLMVLLGRYFPQIDLDAEIGAKLDRLEATLWAQRHGQ